MIATVDLLQHYVMLLYYKRLKGRADWADWFYENHVLQVADLTTELADRFGAWEEIARAAALLHDLGDAVMSRFDRHHVARSISLARRLMLKCGYNDSEMAIIFDALAHHSCHCGHPPTTLEGRVMATADGMHHLTSGFYPFAVAARAKTSSLALAKEWATAKIHRDYGKLLFPEVRAECQGAYETLLALYAA